MRAQNTQAVNTKQIISRKHVICTHNSSVLTMNSSNLRSDDDAKTIGGHDEDRSIKLIIRNRNTRARAAIWI